MAEQTPLHEVLWRARRRKGMTQSELAKAVNCAQSAISMFEAGRSDALSKERVAAIAEKLGVDLSAGALASAGSAAGERRLKFCPVPQCPSNVAFAVAGRACFLPALVEAAADEKTRCLFCGRVLEDACPNEKCRAPVGEGVSCASCGLPYVEGACPAGVDVEQWADAARAKALQIRALLGIRLLRGGPAAGTE